MAEKTPNETDAEHSNGDEVKLIGETSPGVRRIEAISKHITRIDRSFLFFGVFLVAYVYGLDGILRGITYQPYATASYAEHSLLAAINVVRAVVAAAAQPTAAKIADVFGRVELVLVSIVFYVLGTIVEATSHGVQGFSGGAVLYQIGYTSIILLVEVIIADVTTLRSRLLFSYIPAAPFIINTWVSGNIATAVLSVTSWSWGIGMWAIIFPVCSIPLILTLFIAHRKAKRYADLEKYSTPYQMLGARRLLLSLFWQLDVVGILLLITMLALVLVPFTIAGGESSSWHKASTIAPLVVGLCVIPAFIMWERRAPHPLVPFKLLKDRAVWGALGIAMMTNCSWYLQGDYIYTVLVIAFDESVTSATRIASFYSFFSVIAGIIVGGIVFFVRRLKPFIFAGTLLFMVAYGLLIEYRGGDGSDSRAGVIGGQVLLGIAGGFFPYPAQASIQAATRHEHLAVITGLYLASYNVGSALGNTISGAIWTNVLPSQLNDRLSPVTSNSTLAVAAYGDPFTVALEYSMATPERQAIVDAYKHTQRLLCITGICLCVPLIFFGCIIRNPRLTSTQSLPGAEGNGGGADDDGE